MKKMSSSSKVAASKKTTAKKSTASIPVSASVSLSNDASIRVRSIENGFIISESGTKGKGRNMQYFEKERFSAENPIKISISSNKVSFGKKKDK